MTIVTLKKGEGRTIKAGGAWIFHNEIDRITGSFTNGAVVSIEDFDGYPLGKGFINQNSKIRIRMLTRNPNTEITESFFRERIKAAWEYRKNVMEGGNKEHTDGIGNTQRPDLNCCRVIFGEADFLPGLTVDKYNDVLVVECLALGMEQFKDQILLIIKEIMAEDGIDIRLIYERSDARERDKEGLPKVKGVLWSSCEQWMKRKGINDYGHEKDCPLENIIITENGVQYSVDVVCGQKTGFFLDQKYNRNAIQKLCKGKKVLDCFTHMGTFALNAGLAGAEKVLGIDISEFAVNQANRNAEINGLSDTVKFKTANVLDELPKLAEAGEQYDVVILDPPAFTKSREATKNAVKGYREINMKGLKLVRDGGYLATCSCSHFMTQELFTQMMHQAAKSVHKRLRQVEFRTQAPDHPILWNSAPGTEESYYLKFYIFQVCDEK
ncbi:MAG: class I SAM-dependent rRNA methyltransferase [Oscillospiraceae bacterium]|nr:class I SAM-dependent rRNA methyltransferase [Oscillospiraceae bacterium]